MKLKSAILALLCPFAPHSLLKLDYCKCGDQQPYLAGCAYGDCEILRCRACGRVVTYKLGRCYYPYSR